MEQREREIEEDYVLPVTIICFVGAIIIFIMSAVTWYYLVEVSQSFFLGIKSLCFLRKVTGGFE